MPLLLLLLLSLYCKPLSRFPSNHFQQTAINKITSFCGQALINLFLKPYLPKALRKKVVEVVIKITIAVIYSSPFKKA